MGEVKRAAEYKKKKAVPKKKKCKRAQSLDRLTTPQTMSSREKLLHFKLKVMSLPNTLKNSGYVRGIVKKQYEDLKKNSWKYDKINNYKERLGQPRLSDFQPLSFLCSGGHGSVSVVRHKESDCLYAMKTIPTSTTLSVNYIVDERNTMVKMNNNNWMVHLHYAFMDRHFIYYVMDYAPGGDFFDLLLTYHQFPEHMVKYYIAELVLALEAMHSENIIHRDLKLENLFWRDDGHLMLGDMGVVKDLESELTRLRTSFLEDKEHEDVQALLQMTLRESKTVEALGEINSILSNQKNTHYSLAGSIDTMAPEVFKRNGEFYPARDWWSVGIIIYLMLFGCYPFNAHRPEMIMKQIVHFQSTFSYPKNAYVSHELRSLLEDYLICDETKRVGRGKTIQELKSHPWFDGIDWDQVANTSIPSPYVKDMKKKSNFDNRQRNLLLPSLSNILPTKAKDSYRKPIDYLLPGVIRYTNPSATQVPTYQSYSQSFLYNSTKPLPTMEETSVRHAFTQ